ncbi:MAG: hypothetical protein NZM06_04855 [Chloroherpetonaceae bacterium]|nr:hypothetical protein [Chloroherpetonaceae bacterium]MDW8437851.1 hypothetical protein [Chloroherpetonaceae bacterium]
MLARSLALLESAFDAFERLWERKETQRVVGAILICVFLALLVVVELSRRQILTELFGVEIPKNHFYAVNWAFTMLLGVEVLSLVFALAHSISDALGKQFEILSLILLRQSFKEFVYFNEPLQWQEVSEPIWHILSDMIGALLIFGALTIYYRIQKHRPFIKSEKERKQFVLAKKIVGLCLLAIFVFAAINDSLRALRGEETYDFFATFYTVLVFSDVLLVLISLLFSSTYQVVFRNSGFAVATVVIRLALTAPPFVNVGLGLGAALFAIGVTWVYNLSEKTTSVSFLSSSDAQ